MTNENKTAMLLTGDEWVDLARVCDHFLMATRWAEQGKQTPGEGLVRQREIAKRVVEAA